MKDIVRVHPDLQKGVRIALNDNDTDFRKSLHKGTSLMAMLEKARTYVTSRNARLDDFCVYLYQMRVKSSCCLDAVKNTLCSSYMTQSDFASFQEDPALIPILSAHCKCGETIPIFNAGGGKLKVTICGEPQFVIADSLKFCARYLYIDPVQDSFPLLSRGKRIVIPSMSERRDMFLGVMIQIW